MSPSSANTSRPAAAEEEEEEEVEPQQQHCGNEEDLFGFSISEDLVRSPSHEVQTTVSVDFDGLLRTGPLRVHVDLSGGCGGRIWEAGNVLARYLLRTKRGVLEGSESILELGAGGGLVGLAVAAGCNPKSVVHITDQLPMLSLMRGNIVSNGLKGKAEASVYDWGEPRPAGLPEHPQTILAADCVYFEPAFPLLLKTLQDIIGPETTCYFCFKRRRRADLHFIKALKRQFDVVAATDDPDQPAYARQNIFVYTIRHKTTPPLKI